MPQVRILEDPNHDSCFYGNASFQDLDIPGIRQCIGQGLFQRTKKAFSMGVLGAGLP